MLYEVGLGESPQRIAKRLTGDPRRYQELLAANPHKSIVYVGGMPTFASIGVGERIIVPPGFLGFNFLDPSSYHEVIDNPGKVLSDAVTQLATDPGKILNDVKKVEDIVKTVLSTVQSVLSLIPGIGTGISAAIESGIAALEGGSPLDMAIKIAYSAIPIPPGIKTFTDMVLDAAISLIDSLMSRVNAGDAAIASAVKASRDAVTGRLPSGAIRDLGTQVFDTLAHLLIQAIGTQAHVAPKGATKEQLKSLSPLLAGVHKAVHHAQVKAAATKPAAPAPPAPPPPPKKVVALKLPAPPPAPAPPKKVVALKVPPKAAAAPTVPAPQIPPSQPTPPAVLPAPGRSAATYGPYPRPGAVGDPLDAPPHHGRHGGGGHRGGGHPGRGGAGGHRWWRGGWWDGPWLYEPVSTTTTCTAWGDPVEMSPAMQSVGQVQLRNSNGRPAAVRGADGVLYLFAMESGAMTMRPCAAVSSTLGEAPSATLYLLYRTTDPSKGWLPVGGWVSSADAQDQMTTILTGSPTARLGAYAWDGRNLTWKFF